MNLTDEETRIAVMLQMGIVRKCFTAKGTRWLTEGEDHEDVTDLVVSIDVKRMEEQASLDKLKRAITGERERSEVEIFAQQMGMVFHNIPLEAYKVKVEAVTASTPTMWQRIKGWVHRMFVECDGDGNMGV